MQNLYTKFTAPSVSGDSSFFGYSLTIHRFIAVGDVHEEIFFVVILKNTCKSKSTSIKVQALM